VPTAAPSVAALASRLGRHRESLAAVRNLEQLLASIHAGPRVIEGLIPEVSQAIAPMREDAEQLRLALAVDDSPALAALASCERGLLEQLEGALSQADGALTAKKRLSLERQVRALTPELTRVVEHWELLLESVTGGGVTLPLSELLSSRPDHGSSRPLRRLLVFGAPLDVLVTLPPRAALGALSLLAELSRGQAPAALHVTREGESSVGLEFGAPEGNTAGSLLCMIPYHAPVPPSREVAFWVLARIGAQPPQRAGERILLPAQAAGSAG